jgi:hypothetical protein
METRKDESKCPQTQNDPPKGIKGRLERWIEKLEERIAPSAGSTYKCFFDKYNPQGKDVGHC